jgi:hypothetical protein
MYYPENISSGSFRLGWRRRGFGFLPDYREDHLVAPFGSLGGQGVNRAIEWPGEVLVEPCDNRIPFDYPAIG